MPKYFKSAFKNEEEAFACLHVRKKGLLRQSWLIVTMPKVVDESDATFATSRLPRPIS